MKKTGLGRGLSALLDEDVLSDSYENVELININKIEPNKDQPRKQFDDEKLTELSNSIKEHGIIQPLIVRKTDDTYQIIAGERRWRASRLAKLKELPVIVRTVEDDEKLLELALIENIQRENLNPIEEAVSYESLKKKFKLTQDEIATKVGKSRSVITNALRLLKLEEEIKFLLETGEISTGHARTLLGLTESSDRIELANKIVEFNLSVREVEKIIYDINNPKESAKEKSVSPVFKRFENNLKSFLDTKVNIKPGKRKGKIEIEYYSEDDLERILHLIQKNN
ncbi:MAG: ParB/RepB/Spo0J family partition protein [Clostridia bacterium]|jgi:ParB family chromosome partitioning protein|nr:ParB/RepB/Spo0J family partition protein [Clostridia bacterium]